jgi:flagellar hook-associated protein 3 FlgL
MKITYNNLINSVSNSVQTNMKKLQDLQEKLSSGKLVSKPSDNPISIAQLNIYKSKKSQHEQFIKTVDNSLSWLQATENNLSDISTSLVSIREICVQAGNGTLNQEGLNALLYQVEQLGDKLLSDSNAQYLGNYIFAGLGTTNKPFEETGGIVSYNGDGNAMMREISFESNISINIDGARIFNIDNTVSSDPNVFQIIDSLKQALSSGDVSSISSQILDQVDKASTNVSNLISEVGAKVKILELTREQHENDILNIETNISTNEDIDIADVVMELKNAEVIYSTSLSVAGRIIPVTLLDYLK